MMWACSFKLQIHINLKVQLWKYWGKYFSQNGNWIVNNWSIVTEREQCSNCSMKNKISFEYWNIMVNFCRNTFHNIVNDRSWIANQQLGSQHCTHSCPVSTQMWFLDFFLHISLLKYWNILRVFCNT